MLFEGHAKSLQMNGTAPNVGRGYSSELSNQNKTVAAAAKEVSLWRSSSDLPKGNSRRTEDVDGTAATRTLALFRVPEAVTGNSLWDAFHLFGDIESIIPQGTDLCTDRRATIRFKLLKDATTAYHSMKTSKIHIDCQVPIKILFELDQNRAADRPAPIFARPRSISPIDRMNEWFTSTKSREFRCEKSREHTQDVSWPNGSPPSGPKSHRQEISPPPLRRSDISVYDGLVDSYRPGDEASPPRRVFDEGDFYRPRLHSPERPYFEPSRRVSGSSLPMTHRGDDQRTRPSDLKPLSLTKRFPGSRQWRRTDVNHENSGSAANEIGVFRTAGHPGSGTVSPKVDVTAAVISQEMLRDHAAKSARPAVNGVGQNLLDRIATQTQTALASARFDNNTGIGSHGADPQPPIGVHAPKNAPDRVESFRGAQIGECTTFTPPMTPSVDEIRGLMTYSTISSHFKKHLGVNDSVTSPRSDEASTNSSQRRRTQCVVCTETGDISPLQKCQNCQKRCHSMCGSSSAPESTSDDNSSHEMLLTCNICLARGKRMRQTNFDGDRLQHDGAVNAPLTTESKGGQTATTRTVQTSPLQARKDAARLKVQAAVNKILRSSSCNTEKQDVRIEAQAALATALQKSSIRGRENDVQEPIRPEEAKDQHIVMKAHTSDPLLANGGSIAESSGLLMQPQPSDSSPTSMIQPTTETLPTTGHTRRPERIMRTKNFTCRHWKSGYCQWSESECYFAHNETGVREDASALKLLTCFFWKTNQFCHRPDDLCQHAHYDTGAYARSPQYRPSQLSHKLAYNGAEPSVSINDTPVQLHLPVVDKGPLQASKALSRNSFAHDIGQPAGSFNRSPPRVRREVLHTVTNPEYAKYRIMGQAVSGEPADRQHTIGSQTGCLHIGSTSETLSNGRTPEEDQSVKQIAKMKTASLDPQLKPRSNTIQVGDGHSTSTTNPTLGKLPSPATGVMTSGYESKLVSYARARCSKCSKILFGSSAANQTCKICSAAEGKKTPSETDHDHADTLNDLPPTNYGDSIRLNTDTPDDRLAQDVDSPLPIDVLHCDHVVGKAGPLIIGDSAMSPPASTRQPLKRPAPEDILFFSSKKRKPFPTSTLTRHENSESSSVAAHSETSVQVPRPANINAKLSKPPSRSAPSLTELTDMERMKRELEEKDRLIAELKTATQQDNRGPTSAHTDTAIDKHAEVIVGPPATDEPVKKTPRARTADQEANDQINAARARLTWDGSRSVPSSYIPAPRLHVSGGSSSRLTGQHGAIVRSDPPELYRSYEVFENTPVVKNYAGIRVSEIHIGGLAVMKRCSDGNLNLSQILKLAGLDEAARRKMIDKEIMSGHCLRAHGGNAKVQGAWIKESRARDICRELHVEYFLQPLLEHRSPQAPTPQASPKSRSTTGKIRCQTCHDRRRRCLHDDAGNLDPVKCSKLLEDYANPRGDGKRTGEELKEIHRLADSLRKQRRTSRGDSLVDIDPGDDTGTQLDVVAEDDSDSESLETTTTSHVIDAESTTTSVTTVTEVLDQRKARQNHHNGRLNVAEASAIAELKARGVRFESDGEDDDEKIDRAPTIHAIFQVKHNPLQQPPKQSKDLFAIDPTWHPQMRLKAAQAPFIPSPTTNPSPQGRRKTEWKTLLKTQCRRNRLERGDPHWQVIRTNSPALQPPTIRTTEERRILPPPPLPNSSSFPHHTIPASPFFPGASAGGGPLSDLISEAKTVELSFEQFLGGPERPVACLTGDGKGLAWREGRGRRDGEVVVQGFRVKKVRFTEEEKFRVGT